MLVHTRMYTSDRYNTLAQVIITVSKETGRGRGERAAWYAGEAREQRKLNRAESRSNCEEKEYLTNGAKGKNRGRERESPSSRRVLVNLSRKATMKGTNRIGGTGGGEGKYLPHVAVVTEMFYEILER